MRLDRARQLQRRVSDCTDEDEKAHVV